MKLFAFILCVPLTLWQGFCIEKLWNWFLVPIGVHTITIAMAIGIVCLARCIMPIVGKDKKQTDAELIESILTVALMFAISFGIGYLAHLFI